MYLASDLAADLAASVFEGEHIFLGETLKEVRASGVDSGAPSA